MTILLVRPRLIGDVILTTPAIRALRRHFPTATIIYLVEKLAAPVVEANPHLSEVIAIEYRRGWRRLRDDMRLGAALSARRIDVAIDFHGGPRSGWLTWATRAPLRVGYDMPGRQWMYSRVVPRWRGAQARHSVINQWDLVTAVDSAIGGPPTPETDGVEMPAHYAARAAVDRRLAAAGVDPKDRVIVVHVSARNPFRRWPETSFANVISAVVQSGPDRWVLAVGGPSDSDAAGRVIAQARERAGPSASRVLAGEGWTLSELRALMDRSALFIGGDSGPMHVAATSSVPIVALYGPTIPHQWAPWRPAALPTIAVDAGPLPCRPCDQRACAPGDFRCLTRIEAGAVIEAAHRLLETAA